MRTCWLIGHGHGHGHGHGQAVGIGAVLHRAPMIGLVLSCEHASCAVPAGVDLGVDAATLASQAGWDHGAYELAVGLGQAFGQPVHAGAYTRLYVDLNRAPDHPDVIPAVCYGAVVPGNRDLGDDERARRLAQVHAPYWAAVRADVVAALARQPGGCLHLSSHSFAPELDPPRRQFDVGVLYDPDAAFEAELAERLLVGLAAAGLRVRANQPYSGTGPALCTSLRRELAHPRYAGIELEASHDLTRQPGGCARVIEALAPLVRELVDPRRDVE